MAIFRIGFFPEFKGDDVVLVGADRDGMRKFQAVLRTAHGAGQAAFELHGVRHRVIREAGSAEIYFGWQVVNWRLDQYRITHTLNLIDPLIVRPGPGHTYVDELTHPVGTVVLSGDEYTSGGPFDECPQGLPAPSVAGEPAGIRPPGVAPRAG